MLPMLDAATDDRPSEVAAELRAEDSSPALEVLEEDEEEGRPPPRPEPAGGLDGW
jgi:hypothetical protein